MRLLNVGQALVFRGHKDRSTDLILKGSMMVFGIKLFFPLNDFGNAVTRGAQVDFVPAECISAICPSVCRNCRQKQY